MADAAEASSSNKNFSDSDSSYDASSDPKADLEFSTDNQKSLWYPKLAESELNNKKNKQNAIAKQEWKKRFRYLSYKHFLRHTRALNGRQTSGGISPRENKKREEESEGFYADDKGYLQGEIYDELENGDDLGFAGDVSRALNLMPPVSGQERTSEDAELFLRAGPDSDNPEIIVVPSAQFVREISSEN